jgi:hypothetical protein
MGFLIARLSTLSSEGVQAFVHPATPPARRTGALAIDLHLRQTQPVRQLPQIHRQRLHPLLVQPRLFLMHRMHRQPSGCSLGAQVDPCGDAFVVQKRQARNSRRPACAGACRSPADRKVEQPLGSRCAPRSANRRVKASALAVIFRGTLNSGRHTPAASSPAPESPATRPLPPTQPDRPVGAGS